MKIYDEISKTKLVPVVVFNSLDQVEPSLKALIEGGVNTAEICYRTECAPEALKLAIKLFPNMLIGAGTIINKEQCESAISAGAKFIVSPGISDNVYEICKQNNILYIPGVITPTEIIHALDLGLNYLKFFPAGEFGGLKSIKALSAAFPQVKFMPTGGVNNENLKEFVSQKSIFAIGGSWLMKGNIIENCKEAVKIIKGE